MEKCNITKRVGLLPSLYLSLTYDDMSQDFERFLFRKSIQQQVGSSNYNQPAIAALLKRGDSAAIADQWTSAKKCYVAAYFLTGGRGDIIKAKIELVEQLLSVAIAIEQSGERTELARNSANELHAAIDDFNLLAEKLYDMRMELARSEQLMRLERFILTSIEKAKGYLRAY